MRTNGGLPALLLEKARHAKTATYGGNWISYPKNLSPLEALKYDVENLVKICRRENIWDEVAKVELKNYIRFVQKEYPQIFGGNIDINWDVTF